MSVNEKELEKLMARYSGRAERWAYEYQMSGNPSHERAWQRNQAMADALSLAYSAQAKAEALANLKLYVLDLDTSDPDALAGGVRWIKREISNGRF